MSERGFDEEEIRGLNAPSPPFRRAPGRRKSTPGPAHFHPAECRPKPRAEAWGRRLLCEFDARDFAEENRVEIFIFSV